MKLSPAPSLVFGKRVTDETLVRTSPQTKDGRLQNSTKKLLSAIDPENFEHVRKVMKNERQWTDWEEFAKSSDTSVPNWFDHKGNGDSLTREEPCKTSHDPWHEANLQQTRKWTIQEIANDNH